MPAELAEPPMTPELEKSLKSVFDDAMGDVAPAAAVDQDLHDAALPPLDKKDPPPPPKVEAKKPDDKKSDIQRRLAPDFATVAAATKDATKTEETRPEYLKELDAEIDAAKTPKHKADLTKFRDKLEGLEKENTTLKSRPATVTTDDSTSKPVIERLEKENADLQERIGRIDLTQKPAFQRDFLQPRRKAFDEAQGIAKDYGVEAAALQRAISLSGKPRAEALDEIREAITSDSMRGQFDLLIREVDKKTYEINEAIKNHRDKHDEYQRQETIDKQKNIEKVTGELKTLLAAAHRELAEEVKLEVLQKTGNKDFEWWDKQADEIREIAEEILLKSTPEKAAIAAHLAASAGPYRALWQAEREARVDAEKRLQEYEEASPKLGQDRKASKSNEFAADADMGDVIIQKLRAGA